MTQDTASGHPRVDENGATWIDPYAKRSAKKAAVKKRGCRTRRNGDKNADQGRKAGQGGGT
jgi:hypothetical protein